MMAFRFLAIGFSSEPGRRLEREIAAERFNLIAEARDICLSALSIEELFKLTIDNFEEWESELLRQSQELLLWKSDSHVETMMKRLTLDRRLANVLTAFRLYLDQTDHSVSRLCGKAALAEVKAFKNTLYDQHFGYRFIESLRNYIQHRGLGVHVIKHAYRRGNNPKKPGIVAHVSPHFQPENLQAGEFKRQVLDEARSRGKAIDLREPAREYVSCLVDLHGFIRKKIAEKYNPAREYYEAALAEFSTIDNTPVTPVILYKLDGSNQVVEQIAMVKEFFDVYREISERNSRVTDIRSWSVSNAVIE